MKVGPSPDWLRSKIESVGIRSINNIVDITNYILFEWGQPLHAFDFRKLRGGKIVVRRMRSDEKMQLLSKTTIDGSKNPLVIADDERPIALAGIMGGTDTETDEQTEDVLHPLALRKRPGRLVAFDARDPNRVVKRSQLLLSKRRKSKAGS